MIQWDLLGCLIVAWLVVYGVIWKGLHNSGKVRTHVFFMNCIKQVSFQILWFSAIFPYVVLSILCVKALTLEGATNGLAYLYTPQWERLWEAEVWIGMQGFVWGTSNQVGFQMVELRYFSPMVWVLELCLPLEAITSFTTIVIAMLSWSAASTLLPPSSLPLSYFPSWATWRTRKAWMWGTWSSQVQVLRSLFTPRLF